MINDNKVEKIKRVLYGGRRYFGSSGASLTHQMQNPLYKDSGINPSLAQAGLEGERRTTLLLKEWIAKPGHENVVLVDSVHIKGCGKEELNEETGTMDGGDTDHVMIIGNLVIIIDSKNWKSKRKYTISPEGVILRSNKPFPGGRVHAKEAVYLWKNALSQYNPVVTSIVCISSEKVFVQRDNNWWKQPYRLVTHENLLQFLDSAWDSISEHDKNNLNPELITAIITNAIKPYDPVKEKLGSVAHLLN